MQRVKFKSNVGITLIEILIGMAIMGIVMSSAFSVMQFGNKMVKLSQQEYELQYTTRNLLERTSKTIRYSSALFAIPKSSFRADNLTKGWDYIGLNEVIITPAQGSTPAVLGNEVVEYLFDEVSNTHTSKVLMSAQAGVSYEFVFDKVNPQDVDSLLQFSIKRFLEGRVDNFGNPSAELVITTEVEARNSLQVIDLGSMLDPAVALAYRLDDRIKNVVGHVSLVLDKSGSMDKNLAGGNGGTKRISILKDEATTLINSFAKEDNIDIQLVPFATSANNPSVFLNAKSQTANLLSIVSNMTAVGGTNTGDGLRRAYRGLVSHNAGVGAGVKTSNYVVVLVDGVTTFGSVISNSNRTFVTDNSNVNESGIDNGGQIIGKGYELDDDGTAYVNTIGAMLQNNKFARVYVIGFSSVNAELNSVNDIAAACGTKPENIYRAGTANALTEVFESIRQDIVNDLWYLQGPDL